MADRRPDRWMRWLAPDGWAVLAVLVLVLVGNLPALLGLVDVNPLGPRSGMALVQPGFLNGADTLDPNDGYTAQALGHLAATDVLHGHLPWWDPYEGAGAPLLAELQSAALFPPTLLLALQNGQFWEHLLLELMAGASTFLVLRRIGLGRPGAIAGGVAFALNGTFAWLANAPFNPVAFLPLLVLGLEIAHTAVVHERRGGWWLIAVALALSLYAGFPETAYCDGLLAVLWFLWRCGCLGRVGARALLGKTLAGVGGGLLVAAPFVIPVLLALPHENVGNHASTQGLVALPHFALPQLILPYVYGPPLAYSNPGGQLSMVWGEVGGFVPIALVFFGLIALLAPGRRGLKLVLAIWVVLAFSRIYGEPPGLGAVIGVLPRMSSVFFYRYGFPSLEFAMATLAAIGVDALGKGVVQRRTVGFSTALLALALIAAGAYAHELVAQISGANRHTDWAWLMIAWAVLVVGGAALVGLWRRARTPWLLALILVVDAGTMFGVRELAAPRSVTMQLGTVRYLQRHLGDERFFTLGPIQPQYGAYWRIGSVNDDDLPVPSRWTTYVNRHLDPLVNPLVFVGNSGGGRPADEPTPEQQLSRYLNGYRRAGVAYVLTEPGQALPQSRSTFQLVRRTPVAWIYRLNGAAPYFSAAGCTVRSSGRQLARVRCVHAAVLERRELAFPGWSATVDGHPRRLDVVERTFQTVRVPAGTHTVRFAYAPPDIDWALVAFLVGLLWLAVGVLGFPRPKRGMSIRRWRQPAE